MYLEQIENFVIDKETRKLPFYVEMTGITFPIFNYEMKRESPSFYVFEYVIEGSGTVKIDDKIFHPTAGDVYILPKGTKQHYYTSKETPFKKIWMNIGGDLCEQLIQIYHLSGKYHFKNINLYNLFEKFLTICKNRDNDIEKLFNRCSLIFMQIIHSLSAYNKADVRVNEFVLQAKNYCNNHIYDKISVETVAKHVGLSPSQLNRLFKKEYNSTVYAYILNIKIKTAKSLLIEKYLDVKEIAFLLNFSDEHYFTNIFKKKTGYTPTEWRKNKK